MILPITKLLFLIATVSAAVVRRDNGDNDGANNDGANEADSYSQPPLQDKLCGPIGCQFRVQISDEKVEYGTRDPVEVWGNALDAKCSDFNCKKNDFPIDDMWVRDGSRGRWDIIMQTEAHIKFEDSFGLSSAFVLDKLKVIMKEVLTQGREQWTQTVSKDYPHRSDYGIVPPDAKLKLVAPKEKVEDQVLYNGPKWIQLEFIGGANSNTGFIYGQIVVDPLVGTGSGVCNAFKKGERAFASIPIVGLGLASMGVICELSSS